jgi:hypothetical protein
MPAKKRQSSKSITPRYSSEKHRQTRAAFEANRPSHLELADAIRAYLDPLEEHQLKRAHAIADPGERESALMFADPQAAGLDWKCSPFPAKGATLSMIVAALSEKWPGLLADDFTTTLRMLQDEGEVIEHTEPLWLAPARQVADAVVYRRARRLPNDAEDLLDDLVTLDQAAAVAGTSKRTLERHVSKKKLPKPDVPGGGGRAHKWYWKRLRPALETVSRRRLPERFPTSRIVG